MLSAIDRFGFLSQLLMNATLAVDSFLLISGTVTAFSAYSKLNFDRNSSRCFFSFCGALQMFAHRLVRLIPAYLLVFLVVKNLFMLLADGPMWSQQKGVPGTRCNNDDWWKHFLFVTNFISNECMPWMWFLSMNFQFYLVSTSFFAMNLNV
ncbi:unnamed protein product [Toxocara canis]|uniref:Acyl_transf_3 domain-containing protein n=1 Tax=Toxocara canis TaxID=6265 RepID=A0A183USB6_TOXCA|nr:unnamed protein product [Toxocara canis]